jgi:hypothetical protein
MQKWEYLVLQWDGSKVTAKNSDEYDQGHKTFGAVLFELGEDGWEFINALYLKGGGANLIFKRPKDEQ